MNYYFSKTLNANFEQSIALVTEALKKESFGIVSEIDMQAKFKEKLGVDFKKYKILGACNPAFAFKALKAEEKIGTMLPCNIVVIDKENGTTEIVAVDPVASMMAIQNLELEHMANEVASVLKRVIENLN